MTTGWGAPLAAYEFTAAAAEGDAAAADAVWKGLDARGHRDLVLVLGAQARAAAALTAPPRRVPILRGLQQLDLLGLLRGRRVHREARDYAVAALRGAPCRGPRCADANDCLRTAADALAQVQLRTAAAAGFTPAMIAAYCRRAARPPYHGDSPRGDGGSP